MGIYDTLYFLPALVAIVHIDTVMSTNAGEALSTVTLKTLGNSNGEMIWAKNVWSHQRLEETNDVELLMQLW